jgi:hypothetical protein
MTPLPAPGLAPLAEGGAIGKPLVRLLSRFYGSSVPDLFRYLFATPALKAPLIRLFCAVVAPAGFFDGVAGGFGRPADARVDAGGCGRVPGVRTGAEGSPDLVGVELFVF